MKNEKTKDLRSLYASVQQLLKLKEEIKKEGLKFIKDEDFQKNAGDLIPEDLRKNDVGYAFLTVVLGSEKGANNLFIHENDVNENVYSGI